MPILNNAYPSGIPSVDMSNVAILASDFNPTVITAVEHGGE